MIIRGIRAWYRRRYCPEPSPTYPRRWLLGGMVEALTGDRDYADRVVKVAEAVARKRWLAGERS